MIPNIVTAMRLFGEAHAFMQRAGFAHEIEWQRAQTIHDIGESDLLREAAWVILCSGFRTERIAGMFDYLSLCFCDWESARIITAHQHACRETALARFRHERKIDAILKIASIVELRTFPAIKEDIIKSPITTLQDLPYIGPITAYHLAKNLGIPVAKPDRHLQRLASSLAFTNAHQLCETLAKLTETSPSVIDIILWRYAVEVGSQQRRSLIQNIENVSRRMLRNCL